MKIKYKAPIEDRSGLGEASRRIYKALSLVFAEIGVEKIDISSGPAHIIPQIPNPPIYNSIEDYDAVVIFCPPYQFNRFIENGKRNIGYTMWETDKIDTGDFCKIDLLLVPTYDNANAFMKVHNNVKVAAIPHSDTFSHIPKNSKYTFYSIFDWTDRKSPMETLAAYFLEFQDDPEISMIFKTNSKPNIDMQINRLKQTMKLSNFPHCEIISDSWSEFQIKELHQKSHCYVSLSKGEGCNLPLMDAVFYRNQIVSTNCGFVEYLSNHSNLYEVSGTKEPVLGMSFFPYVDATHNWVVPSITDARKKMRYAYRLFKGKAIDDNLLKYETDKLYTKFSPQAIGDIIKASI